MSIILYVQPFTLFGKQFCVVSGFFFLGGGGGGGGGEGIYLYLNQLGWVLGKI